ncbi:PREDICTED: VIP peptides [Nanorana parkeri]|uniref:VIP peptides n=1 Tax=Nanorana parkeri TaxID=125878 RepID=UPI000854A709|nr:PREDICTED: VIP peptides [Nanorana parkeri]
MEHRTIFHLTVTLTLFSVFYLRALALPPLGSYSNSRLGNRLPYEGANEADQTQVSLKQDMDMLQSTLPDNEKFFLDMTQGVGRTSRHADGLFTSGYSKLLGQLSARRYLESLIGKRVSNSVVEDPAPVKRHSDAVFTDNYSRFRKQMAVKKYLNSVLTGKRSQEDINPANLREESDLSQSTFPENYDDATMDDLLNHLPLNL